MSEVVSLTRLVVTLFRFGWSRLSGLVGNRGRCLHIIAFSAGAMAEERERYLAAGMNDFTSKPIIFDEFQALLDRWLPGVAKK